MASERSLSKKIAQQTISIFPALKDRIDQYIEKNTKQKQMLIEYLSRQGEIVQDNDIYYLKI